MVGSFRQDFERNEREEQLASELETSLEVQKSDSIASLHRDLEHRRN
jgi:hypothetical protein